MKTPFPFLVTGLAVIGLTSAPRAGSIEPVSTGTRTSITGAGHSFLPAISGDGRSVLFVSQANNLVTNDNGLPYFDLFVRDLPSGITRLVSVNAAGTGGAAGDSAFASISSNGQFVVFASAANDLVPGDTNSKTDVFIRDTVAGVTRLVSINAAGTGSSYAGAGNPAMSRDGRWVAFESTAPDLGPPKQYYLPIPTDIFLRDVWSNVTVMASVNLAGDGGGNASSVSPVITPDGRFVAFVSQATNLVPGAGNSQGEIYVRDLQSNRTAWASSGVAAFLQSSNIYKADQPLISDDGRSEKKKGQSRPLENQDSRCHRLELGQRHGPQAPRPVSGRPLPRHEPWRPP